MAIDEELRLCHVGINLLMERVMVFFDECLHLLLAWFLFIDRFSIPRGMHKNAFLMFFVLTRDVIRRAVYICENARVCVLNGEQIRYGIDPVRGEIRIPEEIFLAQKNISLQFRRNFGGCMRYGENNRQQCLKEGRKIALRPRMLCERHFGEAAGGNDSFPVLRFEDHMGEGNREYGTAQSVDFDDVSRLENMLELPRAERLFENGAEAESNGKAGGGENNSENHRDVRHDDRYIEPDLPQRQKTCKENNERLHQMAEHHAPRHSGTRKGSGNNIAQEPADEEADHEEQEPDDEVRNVRNNRADRIRRSTEIQNFREEKEHEENREPVDEESEDF